MELLRPDVSQRGMEQAILRARSLLSGARFAMMATCIERHHEDKIIQQPHMVMLTSCFTPDLRFIWCASPRTRTSSYVGDGPRPVEIMLAGTESDERPLSLEATAYRLHGQEAGMCLDILNQRRLALGKPVKTPADMVNRNMYAADIEKAHYPTAYLDQTGNSVSDGPAYIALSWLRDF